MAEEDDDEEDTHFANIFLMVMAVVVVGGGIWLANAMLAGKKIDDCLSSGRRNCAPLDVQSR